MSQEIVFFQSGTVIRGNRDRFLEDAIHESEASLLSCQRVYSTEGRYRARGKVLLTSLVRLKLNKDRFKYIVFVTSVSGLSFRLMLRYKAYKM